MKNYWKSTRDSFIENLIKYRTRKNMSQRELSGEIGKSSAYINQVEAGLSWPDAETIDDICEVLEIPQNFLFIPSYNPESDSNDARRAYIKGIIDDIFQETEAELIESGAQYLRRHEKKVVIPSQRVHHHIPPEEQIPFI